MKRGSVPLLCVAFLALTPAVMSAQGWTLDGYFGRGVYGTDAADVGSTNAVLGIRFDNQPRTWFYATLAAPLEADNPTWSAVGIGRRFIMSGKLSAGIDLNSHAHGYRDPAFDAFGGGLTVAAMPLLAYYASSWNAELRSGLVQYHTALAGNKWSRRAHDTDARLTAVRGPFTLSGEGRYLRAEEDDYPYAGASVTYNASNFQVWLLGGRWFSDAIARGTWEAGAAVAVTDRISVWGSFRDQGIDPLYFNTARKSWNVGLSHRLGGGRSTGALITPEVKGNSVFIRLPERHSRKPLFIGGDFNDWSPTPMVRAGGFWTAQLTLKSGAYHYAFRTADGEWFLPKDVAGRVPDGFGGHVGLIMVP
ncbi:MAG TPA: glycogen-binding domain-containing protein [Longimicrobiales bacterium]|nr:glycogen-binding domain-containing protein [Longimicrobiales bacterium]